ncbi:MAG: hypothetical protein AAGC56_01495 [Pseudomonadota bacterium]
MTRFTALVRAAAFFAVFSLGGPAGAQEPVVDGKAALAAATQAAQAYKDARWAFTMTYTEYDAKADEAGEGGVRDADAPPRVYKLRFDPRRAEGERWKVIAPAPEALSKDERKSLKKLQAAPTPDEGLIYDGLVDVDDWTLVEETAQTASFSGALVDPNTPEKIREAMAMTVDVDKAGQFVEAVRVTAVKPFKPAPIAKVTGLAQRQDYAPLEPGGPVLLRKSETRLSGKAMFQRFAKHTVTTYEDFEQVTVRQPEAEPSADGASASK